MEPWFFSGYDCDSLALEPVTGFAASTLDLFEGLPGACLETLEMCDGGRSAWLRVDHEMYERTGAVEEDTEGFIDYGRGLDGVEVAVMIRQEDDRDRWKVTFRSKVSADVGALATKLGGGGHRHAAGCIMSGTLDEVGRRVRGAVSELFA